MSLRDDLNKLKRELAAVPPEGEVGGKVTWVELAYGTPERRAQHAARCREVAMRSPLMDLLREQCVRLGLPPPTDPYEPDPLDEVIRLAAIPTPSTEVPDLLG